MRKARKSIKRISATSLLVVIITASCVFLFIQYGGYLFIDTGIRIKYVAEIKSSPQLPDRFYQIYNIAYPKSLDQGQWSYYYQRDIQSKPNLECPSRLAAYPLAIRSNTHLVLTSFLLENNVSQKECLNFYANQVPLTKGSKGVWDAAGILYQKQLPELTDKEMTNIILMMNNDIYRAHPDRMQERVDKILQILNKK